MSIRTLNPSYGGALRYQQYAEHKDKTDKKIYAGDIVVADWHWTEPHVIELPDDYYAFTEFGLTENVVTVIGNIYENPELLDKH